VAEPSLRSHATVSAEAREALALRLAAVGRVLEGEFVGPQDVEGCVAGGEVWVVQTRPQP
jgi:hypothetical protein